MLLSGFAAVSTLPGWKALIVFRLEELEVMKSME